MCSAKLASAAVLAVGATLCACLPRAAQKAAGNALVVDRARQEVRLTGVVQKTDAPRMSDWGSAVPALLGTKDGSNARFFLFLLDARIPDIYQALLTLGARPRVAFGDRGVVQHAGRPLKTVQEGYTAGDPVLIAIEWDAPQGKRRLAYEDGFLEKATVDGKEVIRPWAPHFVLHASAILSEAGTGCLACTHDCPGGIIGNNSLPLHKPIPVLKADWDVLPKPGTRITVILRPVASGVGTLEQTPQRLEP
ncbi:MAG: hypothetical protein FJ291_15265 [Planctomycetes bacterium]|nr:hypothetical protein [Planctomycetota bacterium]